MRLLSAGDAPTRGGEALARAERHSERAPKRTRYSSVHGEEQERIGCPVCSAENDRLCFEVQDTMFGSPGKYQLVECQQCTQRYVNPRPTDAALARHYPNDYLCYTNFDAEHWLLRWAFRRMQEGQARRRLRQIEKATGKLPAGSRVLDVGCGRGELMALLKRERNCSCIGTDINPDVLSIVNGQLGIPVVEGSLLDLEFEYGSFDLVTMTEYLEHESRPSEVVERAAKLVKPGGYVAIEVPDISGPPGRWFRENWWQIDCPRHLNFFSPQTLGQLLEAQGLEVVETRRYGMLTSMGYSLLQAMGFRYHGSNKLVYLGLSAALGLPFLPLLPWLPDFMMVIARKK
jgi:SAM-dependent methyltransferase